MEDPKTPWILTLSRDALTHVMAFVPNVQDWSRLLGTGCRDFQWRLFACQPEQLHLTLDKSSIYCLRQMAAFRQLNPNVITWPQAVHFKLSPQSSATVFVLFLIPLINHCRRFASSVAGNIDALHESDNYRAHWRQKLMPVVQAVIPNSSTFDIQLAVPQDASLMPYLSHAKDMLVSRPPNTDDYFQSILSPPDHIHITSFNMQITVPWQPLMLTHFQINLPHKWQKTILSSWCQVIATAPYLENLSITFYNEAWYDNEVFELPVLKSQQLHTLAFEAQHNSSLHLAFSHNIPSLRHLTIHSKKLKIKRLPPQPFELETLNIHHNPDNQNENVLKNLTGLYRPIRIQSFVLVSPLKHDHMLDETLTSMPLLTDLVLANSTLVAPSQFAPTLTRLSISGHRHKFKPSDAHYMRDLAPLFEHLSVLQYLGLTSMGIFSLTSELSDLVPNNARCLDIHRLPKSLLRLDVSNNKLDAIPPNLNTALPQLTHLNVSWNKHLVMTSAKSLEWISTLPVTMQSLDMRRCSIQARNLPKLSHLTHLCELMIDNMDYGYSKNHWALRTCGDKTIRIVSPDFIYDLPPSLQRLWLPVIRITSEQTLVARLHPARVIKRLLLSGVLNLRIRCDQTWMKIVKFEKAKPTLLANGSFIQTRRLVLAPI